MPLSLLRRKSFPVLIPWVGFLWIVTLSGCSSTKTNQKQDVPSLQNLKPKSVDPENASPPRDPLEAIVETWLGSPYQYGGITRKGVDCSGFVKAVYSEAFGLELSRSTRELITRIKPIKDENIQKGDLVFFEVVKDKDYHVGIYLGENHFVHASSTKGVIVSRLDEPYYKTRYIGAGRIVSP